MVNRRRFVTTAAATVVAAALPAFATSASAGRRRKRRRRRRQRRRPRNLTARWWLRRRNARAVLQGDQWHLAKIVDVSECSASAELEQFTISFRCSPGDQVTEGIYKVKVRGGRVKLHIQPAGSDELGNYCVAAVSRLL